MDAAEVMMNATRVSPQGNMVVRKPFYSVPGFFGMLGWCGALTGKGLAEGGAFQGMITSTPNRHRHACHSRLAALN